MAFNTKISTGMKGFDAVIDMLRPGDNVVWQVDSVDDYSRIISPYAHQALRDKRKLVYVHFGRHPLLLPEGMAHRTCCLDATEGFESFATAAHKLIAQEGRNVRYVFDCLTDLLKFWYSDLMIGNFFRVACPFLFQLDTVAYFGIIRNAHTYDTIARIRETTQLLLDVHIRDEKTYIHPLKVWERYSPTMFFPHLIDGDKAVSVTASAQAAQLFSFQESGGHPRDYWEATIASAHEALLAQDQERAETYRVLLINLMLGREHNIRALCGRYLSLKDILHIAKREIGTGMIGGKSVGMLLARKILEAEGADIIQRHWEPHDSFYLGADIFYTYIVHNGWWELRMKQKAPEGYFSCAPELREKLMSGTFPPMIQEQFMRMLEHFGQSPVIVRSSSLLEDNYGNGFAGKYESVFCANQGTPEERYAEFESALRTVYASTMSPDAVSYRMYRGLADRDEQMAVLVQRVSGVHHGDWFFPHVAGVGNSSNLYVWNKSIDPEAGMLRLVLGLGTRAVNRTAGDYARIVALDAHGSPPPVAHGNEKKFSQHLVDVIQLRENRLAEVSVDDLACADLKTDNGLFFSIDQGALQRSLEQGQPVSRSPRVLDFNGLLTATDFPVLAREALSTLARVYHYPVDIEFTVNFLEDGAYVFNLLQCRPLQTKTIGKAVSVPAPAPEDIFFAASGDFMGGNVHLAFDYVIFIQAGEYLALPLHRQYEVARLVGRLNRSLRENNMLLVGPGRWGTSTPSLGVPVYFTELCNMKAICEYDAPDGGTSPDLSFGSHFFQDVVESDIFYAALFTGKPGVVFRPQLVLRQPNLLAEHAEGDPSLSRVVHLASAAGLALYADVSTQKLVCCQSG